MSKPNPLDFRALPIPDTDLIPFYIGSDTSRPFWVSWGNIKKILQSGGGGDAAWGSIQTGTGIPSQTDLVNYLAANFYPLSSNPANYITSSALTAILSNYVTTSLLTSTLTNYVTNVALTAILAGYVTDAELTAELVNYVTNSSLSTTLSSYLTILDRLIINKNGGGTAVTGVITNNVSQFIELPANSISVGDSYLIRVRAEKTGANSAFTMRLYRNSTPNISGSPLLLGTYQASATQTATYLVMKRQFDVETSTSTKTILATQSVTEDVGNGFTQSYNINHAIQNYFVATLQNNSAGDSTIVTSMSLIKIHQV